MITIECTWCDAELTLETLVETSVDCPDCRITVEIAPDSDSLVVAIPVAA
jgi:Zn finger protein HypA/HybF involved in hydrogenase expression